MKQVFLLGAIVCAVLLLSCGAARRNSVSRSELSGAWTLKDIAGEKDVDKIYNESKIPEVVFDVNKLSLAGNNGCNRISGKYKIPQKEKISFGPMISTKMACPGIGNGEQIFMQAISKVNSFRIENDELYLMENDKNVMRFSRKS